jgi:DnaJ family protein B protein 4
VLIDPAKRDEYDKKGSYSLPEYAGVSAYHSAQTLYKSVFGGVGLNEDGRAPEKQPPVVRELSVALEDLYKGATKKLKITRLVLDPKDYSRTIEQSSVIEIEVKPGWKVRLWVFPPFLFVDLPKSGTKITFERMGDEKPGEVFNFLLLFSLADKKQVPADMVFVLSQKPHPLFERQGSHLVFKTSVRLRDALVGGEVRLKTLDDRQLKIPFKVQCLTPCFRVFF